VSCADDSDDFFEVFCEFEQIFCHVFVSVFNKGFVYVGVTGFKLFNQVLDEFLFWNFGEINADFLFGEWRKEEVFEESEFFFPGDALGEFFERYV